MSDCIEPIDLVCAVLGDTKGILRASIEARQIEHLDFDPESEDTK